MRRRLHTLMAILSCCYLYLAPGCGEINQPNTVSTDGKDEELKPVDPIPVEPVVVPPVGGPLVPPGPGVVGGPGGGPNGGGSQGGNEDNNRTGNDDEDGDEGTLLEASGGAAAAAIACSDGLDNDSNGLIDCADASCNGQGCNDLNGCTINDTCQPSGTCVGTAVNCATTVGNECALATCESLNENPGNNNFQCNAILDPAKTAPGSCTPNVPTDNCVNRLPDGTCPAGAENLVDKCLIGACSISGGTPTTPPSFICTGTDKETAPEPAGCNDSNDCTGDDCNEVTGACSHDTLNGNVCTADSACEEGVCVNGSCSETPRGACTSSAECAAGFVCTLGACTCDDGNTCTAGDTCNLAGACTGTPTIVALPCDDGNACTANDACSIITPGICAGAAQAPTCPDAGVVGPCVGIGSICTNVTPGNCSITTATVCTINANCPLGETCINEVNRCSCSDGVDCTVNTCNAGTCGTDSLNDAACLPDLNVCTDQTCTATGCVTSNTTGPVSCVTAPVAPATECFEGTIQCTNGVAGACVANDPPVVAPCV